jgi:hypothetical protein
MADSKSTDKAAKTSSYKSALRHEFRNKMIPELKDELKLGNINQCGDPFTGRVEVAGLPAARGEFANGARSTASHGPASRCEEFFIRPSERRAPEGVGTA